jgi:RNA-directed DNA polymerase
VLHPEKTKIVYCKDVNRRGDFPVISFDFLGFQFRARKTMGRKGETRTFAHSFQPAASPKALTRISRAVRGWALHHRSDKSLTELATMYNPLDHLLQQVLSGAVASHSEGDRRLCHSMGPCKYKRMVHQTKGARDWFVRLRRATPKLFAHWPLCHGNGRTSGAV